MGKISIKSLGMLVSGLALLALVGCDGVETTNSVCEAGEYMDLIPTGDQVVKLTNGKDSQDMNLTVTRQGLGKYTMIMVDKDSSKRDQQQFETCSVGGKKAAALFDKSSDGKTVIQAQIIEDSENEVAITTLMPSYSDLEKAKIPVEKTETSGLFGNDVRSVVQNQKPEVSVQLIQFLEPKSDTLRIVFQKK